MISTCAKPTYDSTSNSPRAIIFSPVVSSMSPLIILTPFGDSNSSSDIYLWFWSATQLHGRESLRSTIDGTNWLGQRKSQITWPAKKTRKHSNKIDIYILQSNLILSFYAGLNDQLEYSIYLFKFFQIALPSTRSHLDGLKKKYCWTNELFLRCKSQIRCLFVGKIILLGLFHSYFFLVFLRFLPQTRILEDSFHFTEARTGVLQFLFQLWTQW